MPQGWPCELTPLFPGIARFTSTSGCLRSQRRSSLGPCIFLLEKKCHSITGHRPQKGEPDLVSRPWCGPDTLTNPCNLGKQFWGSRRLIGRIKRHRRTWSMIASKSEDPPPKKGHTLVVFSQLTINPRWCKRYEINPYNNERASSCHSLWNWFPPLLLLQTFIHTQQIKIYINGKLHFYLLQDCHHHNCWFLPKALQ